LILLPLALLQKFLPATAAGWGVLLGCAMTAQVLGQGLIAYALAHLPATFGAVGLYVQVVAAGVYAWLLLGERLAPVQIAGGAVRAPPRSGCRAAPHRARGRRARLGGTTCATAGTRRAAVIRRATGAPVARTPRAAASAGRGASRSRAPGSGTARAGGASSRSRSQPSRVRARAHDWACSRAAARRRCARASRAAAARSARRAWRARPACRAVPSR